MITKKRYCKCSLFHSLWDIKILTLAGSLSVFMTPPLSLWLHHFLNSSELIQNWWNWSKLCRLLEIGGHVCPRLVRPASVSAIFRGYKKNLCPRPWSRFFRCPRPCLRTGADTVVRGYGCPCPPISAVYQKPKSSSNRPKRSWFIIIWTLVLTVSDP